MPHTGSISIVSSNRLDIHYQGLWHLWIGYFLREHYIESFIITVDNFILVWGKGEFSKMSHVEDALILHREKLLRFIQKRVNNPDLAEDILQEGLLKALQSSGDLRDDERVVPWFYRILNNAMIDTYRKRNVEMRYLETYGREIELETKSEDQASLCECFRELLPSMKPEYAELIDRLELQPGDPGQVAQQLNIHPNNLKVRRYRARQALKQRLEETCRMCAVHGCLDCTCQLSASL